MDDQEIRNLEWWKHHHEKNIQHLLVRIEQMLNGEDVTGIMKATLEGYRKTYPKE